MFAGSRGRWRESFMHRTLRRSMLVVLGALQHEPAADAGTRGGRSETLARLRNYFLTGLVLAGPAGITLYLTWSLISWADSWVKPYLPDAWNPDKYLPIAVPGVGLLIAMVAITLIGFTAANIVGRTLWSVSEDVLHRMPVVRNLYKALKQIFASVLAERGSSFKQAALLQFPHPGLWTIGFVATEAAGEIVDKIGGEDRLLSVYVPTTPNPTGGYLVFAKARDVRILDMSVEDAAKFVISFGLVRADGAAEAGDMVRRMAQRLDAADPEPKGV